MRDDRMIEATKQSLTEGVAKVARRLRHLADEVEREGEIRSDRVMGSPGAAAAQGVIHSVTWGMANLNLGGLVSRADRLDEALRAAEHSPTT